MNLTATQKNNANKIIDVFKGYGITNKNTIAAVLSVVMKESALIPKSENLKYSKERLPEVWGAFSTTGKKVPKGQGKNFYNQKAIEFENNDKKLGDFVYGSRFGNKANEGFTYRGRGYNQLTFHDNYKTYGILINEDLTSNPDKVNDSSIAAKVLFYYMFRNAKNNSIDLNNLTFENAYNTIYSFNAGLSPKLSSQELMNKTESGGYLRGRQYFPLFLSYVENLPDQETKKKINIGLIIAIGIIALILYKNK